MQRVAASNCDVSMKLLQILASAGEGGAEAFFERLAVSLNAAGIEQKCVLRRSAERNDRLRAKGVDVAEVSFGGLFDFVMRPAIRKIIREFKPDVVLTWMNRATSLCPAGDFVHVARLGGYYNLKYYKNCDHLIGNTHGIVKYLRENGWPEDRVHYLPNFVSVEKVEKIARASLDTPENEPLLLALGRLHPNKGFDVLIAAMEKLPKFHLWLGGDGDERQKLELQAQKVGVSDRVHFIGWRSGIASLYATADIYVCSSRYEPLGNVVIEAWAAGTPVVAADSMGPHELIRDGETGLLVPVDNANELAKAIKRLWEDSALQDHVKQKAYDQYLREFTEDRVVAIYKAFFERIVR
jgi:glycosyltransferase involved in cell wall biosynthesis